MSDSAIPSQTDETDAVNKSWSTSNLIQEDIEFSDGDVDMIYYENVSPKAKAPKTAKPKGRPASKRNTRKAANKTDYCEVSD